MRDFATQAKEKKNTTLKEFGPQCSTRERNCDEL
jgi:hypothetical protein